MTLPTNKNLFALLGKFEKTHSLPPVDDWHPKIEGVIDIVINEKGEWFHEGGHFDRQDLARMFASIMRKEGEDYFLVTPTEKLKIHVSDVPFSFVLMKRDTINNQQQLTFITSLGDEVVVDANHKIEFRASSRGDQIPYIEVRNDLWGKLNQSTYYELMNYLDEQEGSFVIKSCGINFSVPS